jgi:hypothetical protein
MQSSSSSSSSHPIPAQSSFFNLALQHNTADWIRDIWLFASNPSADLCVNRALSDIMRHSGYWRQLLQRDFGLSRVYCDSLINAHQDPVATLRAVYQRLNHLKTNDISSVYQQYKDLILDPGVNFLPLSAIGPSYPEIKEDQRQFYLCEAIRLGNTELAAHILLQVLLPVPENSRRYMLLQQWISWDTIDVAIKIATQSTKKSSKDEVVGVDNTELLRRMLPHMEYHRFRKKVVNLILSNETISPANAEVTKDLNQIIANQGFYGAMVLLQRGAAPNRVTLMMACQRDYLSFQNEELIAKLVSLIPTYPQILDMTLCGPKSSDDRYFNHINNCLLKKADIALTQAVYESAKQFSSAFDRERLADLFRCLLEVIVMRGDLDALQQIEKKARKQIANQVVCLALQHGQLAILQHFIKQINKNTLLCTNEIFNAIMLCGHKSIVKYLVEEFKIFNLDEEEKSNNASDQGVISYLFGLWEQVRNGFESRRLSSKDYLLDLKTYWLASAAYKGNVDVFDYFRNEAPEDCKLMPDESTLGAAINHNQDAAVRYLIEACGIKPKKEHILYAGSWLHADISLYLINHCIADFTLQELPPQALMWNLIGNIEKPNDDLNQLLDWVLGPNGKQRGYQLDELISNLYTSTNAPMLAWLQAKFKRYHSADFLSTHRESSFRTFEYHVFHFLPDMIRDECRARWQSLYADAFHFYYQKYSRDLCSADVVSSSAVILSVIKPENMTEQKDQSSSQVQHEAPLVSTAATSSASNEERDEPRLGLRK